MLGTVKAVSFDVFDTLVTRKYAYPTDLFFFVERRLRKLNPKFLNYAEKRISTEFDIRKKRKFYFDISFDEIFNQLQSNTGFSDDEISIIKNNELNFELQSIRPILETIELVRFLEGRGKRVFFISDTYFSERFIREILIKWDIIGVDSDSRVYVSSATGKQKSNGMLYHHVMEKEGLEPSEICHIGDKMESDCNVPKQLGMRAIHYSGSELNRYERTIYSDSNGPMELRSLLTGLCRGARLECPYKDAQNRTIWNVAANVAGPLITGYVKWCLEKAEASGLKRLYFMSRDGQIALNVAHILKKAFGYHIKLKYLYVSRHSLLMPAMRDDIDEEFKWICSHTSKFTLRILFDRLYINIDEILDILKRHGFENKGLDDPILPAEFSGIREIMGDPRFKKILGRKIEEQKELVFQYLHQEGLDQDGAFALVDIGWSGTLQRSISRILEDYSKLNSTQGFYLALKNIVKNKETDVLSSYYDFRDSEKSKSETHMVPMLEIFFAADHGPVIGFKKDGDRVAPVLKTESNENGIRWGLPAQQEGIKAFANMLASENRDLGDFLMNAKDIHLTNLKKFFFNPSDQEAAVYGAHLYSEEQKEAYHLPLAERYTFLELIRHRFFGYMHHHDEWIYASRRMSNQFLYNLLNFK